MLAPGSTEWMTPVKGIFAAVVGLMLVSSALSAETFESPPVKEGDSWTYRITTEKGAAGWNQVHNEITVTRVTPTTIFISVKVSGSTQAPREVFVGSDWSRSRDVNGKETVVNKPFVFPLSIGKSWDLAYQEDSPNAQHKFEKFQDHFNVVGFEDIDVPAGKFRALKIEADGHWEAELAPAQSVVQGAQSGQNGTTLVTQVQKTTDRQTSGRLYKAYWYAPEVKRWVKSIEENYSSGGVRNERFTQELESFRPAGAKND